MISSLRGAVAATGQTWLHLSVGGVGFRIEAAPSLVADILSRADGGDCTVHTYLVVREDALTLYGFGSAEDRDGFETLMSVSGVGPKLALAAIDVLGLNGLRKAIATGDLVELARIPGVGKKTAQRLVLEIGEKLGAPEVVTDGSLSGGGAATGSTQIRDSVEAALEQLGWPRAVAQRAVDKVEGEHTTTESMLRAALASLGTESARGF